MVSFPQVLPLSSQVTQLHTYRTAATVANNISACCTVITQTDARKEVLK